MRLFALAILPLMLLGCAAPSPPQTNVSFPLFYSANLSEGEALFLGDLSLRAVRINATASLLPDNRTCIAGGGSILLQAASFGLGPSDIQLVEGQTALFGNASITLRSISLDVSPERRGNCSFSAEGASFNITAPFPAILSLAEGGSSPAGDGAVKVLSIRKTIGTASPVTEKVLLAKGSSYSISNGSYRISLPPQSVQQALAVALSRATLYKGESFSVGSETIEVEGFDITLTTPLYPSWSCNVLNESVMLSIRSPTGTSEIVLHEGESFASAEGAFVYVNRITEAVNPDPRGCATAGERAELTYSSTSPCSHADARANLDVTPFGRMTTTYLVGKGQWLELGPSRFLRVLDIDQAFSLNHSTGACISSPESISLEITTPASHCPVIEKSALIQLSTPLLTRAQVLTEGASFSVGSLAALVKEIHVETSTPLYGSCTIANQSVLLEMRFPQSRALGLVPRSSANISQDLSIEFVSADASVSMEDGTCAASAPSAIVRTTLHGLAREDRIPEGGTLLLAEGTSVSLMKLNYSLLPPPPICTVRKKAAFLDISYH